MCRHHLFVRLATVLFVAVLAMVDLVSGQHEYYHIPSYCHACSFQPLRVIPKHHHHRRRKTVPTRLPYQDEKRDDATVQTMVEHQANCNKDNDEYDPITDWSPPPPNVVQETIQERIAPLQKLTSPKFFSTDAAGRRHTGLGHLPSSRPLVIVGNHQLGGLDIWLIVPELIEERDVFVRGLGHPVIFHDEEAHLKGGPTFLPDTGKQGTFGLYQKFGAVQATPKNLYRLLQTNQTVLHFPGGAREAYHGREEAYQLFWPSRQDFVRMAAKFNATIVPLSGIGAADSVHMLANPETLLQLPFGMGDYVANSFLTVREAARYDEIHSEYIRPPPLVVPKLVPARHYFLFGRPFDTSQLDARDREACRELYQQVQDEVNCGLQDLVSARQTDPFQDSVKRFVYEEVTGKQAPTFSITELNKDRK